MKISRSSILVAVTLLSSLGFATSINIKGSSGSGTDSDAVNWLLQGRSTSTKYSANGKAAFISREVVCVQQDVEATLFTPTQTLAGSCDSGNYMFLFQLQSTSANVNLVLNSLKGLNTTDFGVMICDNSSVNSIEMCTNATASQIPSNITATLGKTSITFTVPGTFPSYPAGTPEQGQGLTFYVITQQTPLPLSLPKVGIH